MRVLNLANLPSQSFSIRLEDKRFTLRLKQAAGVMMVDITCDGKVLVEGQRVLSSQPLIPYQRLEYGNFILLSDHEALPDWQAFGKTQTLIYLTPSEIAELKMQKAGRYGQD